ncbi:hypothetical protein CFC21_033518 [Triticum aestivum]|uniref:ARC105/Med15 mediator subunit C-terminal domain-containing protein n=4 Tax=Triticum TaxID=4564 RepID=A0A9R1F1M6_WHEAT|nr:hypothetical protein CFC21_033518 [Triticum aestivum]
MGSQGDLHGGGGGRRNQGHADGPEPLDQSCRHDAALRIANAFLDEEIKNINNSLVDTEINVISDSADAGTLITLSYMAVAVAPDLKAIFARSEKPPISAAKLLVPTDYPRSSPVLVEDDEDAQERNEFKAMSNSVHKQFKLALAEHRSINDIAREWDSCVRAAVLKLAKSFGGGTFTSRYGKWESVSSLGSNGAAAKGEDHECDRAETTISEKSTGKSEITPADGHSNTRGHACSTPALFPPLQPQAHRTTALSTHSFKQWYLSSIQGDLAEELQKMEVIYNVIMERQSTNERDDLSDLWLLINEGVKKCKGILLEIHALGGSWDQEIDPKFIW